MRTIITGGTGLIGRALAACLARDGHEVILLSRSPERATDLPTSVRAVRWDGHSARGWGTLIDGDTALVNLAGASVAGGRWTPERRRLIQQSRVHAGQAVVQGINGADQKPKVLVQSSAVGYYGPHGDDEVTEATPAGSDFLAKVCLAWEDSTAAVEGLGVRRVVIRTGIVLSMKGGALPRLLLPFRLFAGGPVGGGHQWYPWLHIADEVGAIRFLIETETARGPFNLVAPHPLTNSVLSRVVGRAMRRPSFLPAPAFALRLTLGDMASVVLDGQRALPTRLMELGYRFRFPEADAALRDLLQR